MSVAAPSVLRPVPLTPELRDFCVRLDILDEAQVVVDLVSQCFPNHQSLTLYPSGNPETDEQWLVVEVSLREEVPEVLRQYDAFTEAKLAAIPNRKHDRIRLSYHVI